MKTMHMPVREPMPRGIPLTPCTWIPAALILAALPLALGVLAKARQASDPSPGTRQITGCFLEIDAKDEVTGPVSITALRCELSGSFPADVSFHGRTLVLTPDFEAPVLHVHCAIIEGDRDGLGQLRGSYQALR